MKLAALFGKLDDWLNPIVVKELRQAVRSRVVVAGLMLFLLLEIGILALYILNSEVDLRRDLWKRRRTKLYRQ